MIDPAEVDEQFLPYRGGKVGLRVRCSIGKDDFAFFLYVNYAEELHQGEVLVVSIYSAQRNEAYQVVGVFALECKQQTSLGRHPALPREGIEVQRLFVSQVSPKRIRELTCTI